MTEAQLDFAGREVPIGASTSHWHPTGVQILLLRLARRPEGVTALQAGIALHTRRKALGTGGCGWGAKADAVLKPRGCCAYAPSDGSASLKRLQQRGVVEQRRPRGPYFAVLND
jgi:hypothetical protein